MTEGLFFALGAPPDKGWVESTEEQIAPPNNSVEPNCMFLPFLPCILYPYI